MRFIGGYIFVGIITVAPLWVTWLILEFLLGQLARLGRPWVQGIAVALSPRHPSISDWLLDERVQSLIAAAVVLVFLLFLGWGTTRVVGRRLIASFERVIGYIPFVHAIYRSTKRFISVASTQADGERRVVLIDFPSTEMKAIGFITQTLMDSNSGQELAAVYVPTSPNPTSGYVEIVPTKNIVHTDWTFDQAMAFVVTGGSSAPPQIQYTRYHPNQTV